MRYFGIDISKWQGDFNFPAAVKEGVSFAVIKGGGGDDSLYTDSKFAKNYKTAKENNVPVGVYWFSKATTLNEASAEADYFYNNILKNRQFELPVFIDVEHPDMLAVGKPKLTAIVKKWCDILEKKGFWVGIYASVYGFSAYMNDVELLPYTHWVAQWAEECTYENKDVLGFWQFGGETNLIRSNLVAGVVCDQNYMYLDFPSIIKEKKLNGFDKTVTNDVPENIIKKKVDVIAAEVIAGKWGVGADRKKRLTDAGYNYNEVQALVDKALYVPVIKPVKDVKAGDMARLSADAVIYGTNQKFASFVYSELLYVRELNGNRAVISLLSEGPVTGAVDVKYLTKYNP